MRPNEAISGQIPGFLLTRCEREGGQAALSQRPLPALKCPGMEVRPTLIRKGAPKENVAECCLMWRLPENFSRRRLCRALRYE